MPGKSKRGKARRYQQSKTGKVIQRQNTVAAATTETAAPAAPAAPAAVQTAKPAAAAAAKANQYTYVAGDLRRISMLTGIIIVILLILYFVLP